jgi:hypothetical protein
VVENTGKTLRTDTYRPVNVPETVKVEEDASGSPALVVVKRRSFQGRVISTEDRWRIDDEWWRSEPVTRLYYNVLLVSGQRLVLYKDLTTNEWYQQDY